MSVASRTTHRSRRSKKKMLLLVLDDSSAADDNEGGSEPDEEQSERRRLRHGDSRARWLLVTARSDIRRVISSGVLRMVALLLFFRHFEL